MKYCAKASFITGFASLLFLLLLFSESPKKQTRRQQPAQQEREGKKYKIAVEKDMELRITSCLGPLFEIEVVTAGSPISELRLPASSLVGAQAKMPCFEGWKKDSNTANGETTRARDDETRRVRAFLAAFFPQMWKKMFQGWKFSIEELAYLQYVSHGVWKVYGHSKEDRSSPSSTLPLLPASGGINSRSSRPCGIEEGQACPAFFPRVSIPQFSMPIPLFSVLLQGETVQERFQSLSQLQQNTCFLYRVLSWNLGYVLRHGGSQFGAYFIGYTRPEFSTRFSKMNEEIAPGTPPVIPRNTSEPAKAVLPMETCGASSAEWEMEDCLPFAFSSSHHGDVLFFPCSATHTTVCSSTTTGATPSPSAAPPDLDVSAFARKTLPQEKDQKNKKGKQKEEGMNALLSAEAGIRFSLYTDSIHAGKVEEYRDCDADGIARVILAGNETREGKEGGSCPPPQDKVRKRFDGGSPNRERDVEENGRIGKGWSTKKRESESSSSSLAPSTRSSPPSAKVSSGGPTSRRNSGNHCFTLRSFFSSTAFPFASPCTVSSALLENTGKRKANMEFTPETHPLAPFSSPSSFSSSNGEIGVITTLELHSLDAIRASRVARSVKKRAYWCGVVDHRWERWERSTPPQCGGLPSARLSSEGLEVHSLVDHPHLHCCSPFPNVGDKEYKAPADTDKNSIALKEEEMVTGTMSNRSGSCQFLSSSAEFLSCTIFSTEEVGVVLLPVY